MPARRMHMVAGVLNLSSHKEPFVRPKMRRGQFNVAKISLI